VGAVSRSSRALLIDRHPLVLAALARLLSSEPLCADVIVTTRSDTGLEMAKGQAVDVVVCDIKAGPVGGAELAGALTAQCPGVRVILMADGGDEPLLVASLMSGATGFFTKDTPIDEFFEGVEAVIKGHYAVGRNLLQSALARLAGEPGAAPRTAAQLSPAEHDILVMIGQAQSVRTIAEVRGISHKTVRNHLANIYRKLGLRSRTEAILWAAEMGLIRPTADFGTGAQAT
jgi:DNA-binding NarL/FixJ family response regulator